jgi:hypothetical protein
MKVEEVNRYSAANFMVHSYSSVETEALPAFLSLEVYFAARPHLSQPQEVDLGVEKLLLYLGHVNTMVHVGEQLQTEIDGALKIS